MIGFGRTDVLYTPLPLFHSNAMIIFSHCILPFGNAVVLRKKFSASRFWDDCVKYQVNGFNYIGEIARFLLALTVCFFRNHNLKKYILSFFMFYLVDSKIKSKFCYNQKHQTIVFIKSNTQLEMA